MAAARQVIVQTSPSLALVKYWGKSDVDQNLPATPSLAMTLRELGTETRTFAVDPGSGAEDLVVVDAKVQNQERFAACFRAIRAATKSDQRFWVESTNNFPTAAGLASSSSGFAALVMSAVQATGVQLDQVELSALARLGSASAARSLFGGFTWLDRHSSAAEQLWPADHWPDLRVLVVEIDSQAKALSSREAMERTRRTSPYYAAWVADAVGLAAEARQAVKNRDLATLGPLINQSYLRMFATMFAAAPPIVYWQPDSLRIIQLCANLRAQGLGAWETMDAGPQVKIFALDVEMPVIAEAVRTALPGHRLWIDQAGSGPRWLTQGELLGPVHPLIQAQADRLGIGLA